MQKAIFNNLYAADFFSSSALAFAPKMSAKAKIYEFLDSCLGVLLGDLPPQNRSKRENIYLYSDDDLVLDFGFLLAAAAAARQISCAYITPTPQNYSLALFSKAASAKNLSAQDKKILEQISQNLFIAYPDVCSISLRKSGFELAVCAPFCACFNAPDIPHVLVGYSRQNLLGYRLIHFKCAKNYFCLSSAKKRFKYYFAPPKNNTFAPNLEPFSEQIADFMLSQNVNLRNSSSRLDEFAALLSYAQTSSHSLSIRASTNVCLRLKNVLIPIDLSPQNRSYELGFCIKSKPSF